MWPHFKTRKSLEKNENVVMGPETNNDCAGEGQHQIIGLDWKMYGRLEILNPGIRWEVTGQLHVPAALHPYNWDSKLRVHSS
jgi:hypothetical protein